MENNKKTIVHVIKRAADADRRCHMSLCMSVFLKNVFFECADSIADLNRRVSNHLCRPSQLEKHVFHQCDGGKSFRAVLSQSIVLFANHQLRFFNLSDRRKGFGAALS